MAEPQLFDLTGRTAVVTGALGKLGRVWVDALLSAGAAVAALDLAGAKPSPAFASLAEQHPADRLRVYAADVTDRPSLEAALERCTEELGAPAVLVNNAGIDQPPAAGNQRQHWHEIPPEVCRRILDVNLVGT